MTFNSLQFFAFFAVVLTLYYRLARRQQNVLLLVASWLFYAFFDWRFLGLMLVSTTVDFFVGRTLERETNDRRRMLVFSASLCVNLGILAFFKYAGFFADSAGDLLQKLGLDRDFPTLNILLPVGISFYTFHGISYTFDVYRREIRAARDFLDFAVFVAYFPQLVAGPIGRAQFQLPQFQNERPVPSANQRFNAVLLILVGLFQKVVIADGIASYVNSGFANSDTIGWKAALVATVGFSIQIYGDFCGYSNIARGASRLMGIELPLNFTEPYFSRNITEFWQRWHISLSTWLRDYLYIPLGGNRQGARRTYRNLMITMLLGGLWHGAAWTFVAWGAIHGSLLAGHRFWTERRHRLGLPPPSSAPLSTLARALTTFAAVAAAFVVFRADDFGQAVDVLRALVTLRSDVVSVTGLLPLALAVGAALVLDAVQRLAREDRLVIERVPSAVVGAAAGAAVVSVLVFSGGTPTPFIYFQF